jgi:hypothetical protein
MIQYSIGDIVNITFKEQLDIFNIRDKVGLIMSVSQDTELDVPCYTVLVDDQIYSLYEHEFESINEVEK